MGIEESDLNGYLAVLIALIVVVSIPVLDKTFQDPHM